MWIGDGVRIAPGATTVWIGDSLVEAAGRVPVLVVDPGDWQAFLSAVKAGGLDR